MKNRLIDIRELAEWLGVAVGTIYQWAYLRKIPFKKVGRCLRFAVDEIDEWLLARSTMGSASKR
jgi:excisionase family DNA binding protein